MAGFSIKKASNNELNAINELINQVFGQKYHLQKTLIGPNCLSFVAKVDKEIVGFTSAIIHKNDLHGDSTAVLDVIVVKKAHQKKGYGKALFGEMISSLTKHNVKHINLYHWVKKESKTPLIALKHGFKFCETIPNYWSKESVKHGYHCAECGPPPCSCSCKVYQKITIT